MISSASATTRQQFVFCNVPALVEFLLTVAFERPPSHAADHPHRDIATQVEDKISNAVRRVVRPPPDILFAEAMDTRLDLRQVVRRQEET